MEMLKILPFYVFFIWVLRKHEKTFIEVSSLFSVLGGGLKSCLCLSGGGEDSNISACRL